MRLLPVLVVLFALLAGCSDKPSTFDWPEPQAPDDPALDRADLDLDPLAGGFDRPVAALPVPDGSGRTLVVQQDGRVIAIEAGAPAATPWLDIHDQVGTCHHEQGLLGLAFSPAFATDSRFYVTYTDKPCEKTEEKPERKGDVRLSRFTALPGVETVDPTTEEVLLTIQQPFRNHNGGHLIFGPDGHLYMGVGDGGGHGDPGGNGQDRKTLLGSILRLDVSAPTGYAMPSDNPFIGDDDGRDEIYVYGLRNPWRFSFDTATGDLWIADVGQNDVEEVDRLRNGEQAGANLGWSLYEGTDRFGTGTAPDDLVFPVAEYRHGGGNCSVTGGPFLRDTPLPGLEGTYLFSDFCSGHLWAVHPEDDHRVESLGVTGLQVTGFGTDAEGNVLLLHWAGDVHRLVARDIT
ncbi:MAG: PQQ-dependent sugar dehydrogenase [Euryarchaeota archaeon]|nr:PQQ-dependent sugar dehydrogenase [Euryarchaeota archaeon]